MTYTKDRRPGDQPEAAARVTTTTNAKVAPRHDIPRARAYAGPPVRGRSLWAVTVLSCPCCRAMHQHRISELGKQIDKACPVTGEWYRLGPIQRRREAVRHV